MRIVRYISLASRVLAVATLGDIEDWTAYVDAVRGESHDNEVMEVTKYGEKLPFEIAKILFPEIAAKYKWRE